MNFSKGSDLKQQTRIIFNVLLNFPRVFVTWSTKQASESCFEYLWNNKHTSEFFKEYLWLENNQHTSEFFQEYLWLGGYLSGQCCALCWRFRSWRNECDSYSIVRMLVATPAAVRLADRKPRVISEIRKPHVQRSPSLDDLPRLSGEFS